MKKLAILGGEPTFKHLLHVGRPNLPDKRVLLKHLDSIFESRWLTNNGPLVKDFKVKLEEVLQVRNCIPICNGTIALELAERALGFQDEVILPSFTFVATAHSLQWQRITPVFADIGKQGVTIDPESIHNMITPRTTGIIGVHVYAYPCDYIKIEEIAEQKNIKVLYDAAHGFCCSVDNIPYANLGDATVFSFHATKFFNTFEGGAIATNDDSLAEEVRLMANFGFTGGIVDQVDYLGINGKMTEISAAMGLAMLDSIEQIREKNRQNFEAYREAFGTIEGIELIEPPLEMTNHNWQYVIIRLDCEKFGLSRDTLVKVLRTENVFVRRYFYPGCHRMYPYREYFPNVGLLLQNTERLADQVIAFPTGQGVQEDDIKAISNLLNRISDNSEVIRNQNLV